MQLAKAVQSAGLWGIVKRTASVATRHVCTTSATSQAAASVDAADDASMEFPGGRVPFGYTPQFVGGVFDQSTPKIPCYRTLDGTGQHIQDAMVPHELSQEQATQIYTSMAKLQVMDTICYDAQRQVCFVGRCSSHAHTTYVSSLLLPPCS